MTHKARKALVLDALVRVGATTTGSAATVRQLVALGLVPDSSRGAYGSALHDLEEEGLVVGHLSHERSRTHGVMAWYVVQPERSDWERRRDLLYGRAMAQQEALLRTDR